MQPLGRRNSGELNMGCYSYSYGYGCISSGYSSSSSSSSSSSMIMDPQLHQLRDRHLLSFVVVLSMTVVALMASGAYSADFDVGGSAGWTLPSAADAVNYTSWANSQIFVVGDVLCMYTHIYVPNSIQ